ncbi:hypothetical protein L1987_24155 [Smallanthus sonchifolius]|uniref:Uncharacterized protein n=1 Tax=Smallanthus sonchifolius TaxID=185202 RepID=A0ACB9IJE8_9ASTR|nr:hypothetical protein L1987_24155 [Smallanthus sonchifolius]
MAAAVAVSGVRSEEGDGLWWSPTSEPTAKEEAVGSDTLFRRVKFRVPATTRLSGKPLFPLMVKMGRHPNRRDARVVPDIAEFRSMKVKPGQHRSNLVKNRKHVQGNKRHAKLSQTGHRFTSGFVYD